MFKVWTSSALSFDGSVIMSTYFCPLLPLHLFGHHSLTITILLKVPYSVGVEHLNSAFNLCVAMLLCKSEAISVLNVES